MSDPVALLGVMAVSNHRTINFTFGADISGYSAITFKMWDPDDDSLSVVSKTLGSGVTVTSSSATSSVAAVAITPSDTTQWASIKALKYLLVEIERTNASSEVVTFPWMKIGLAPNK